MSAVIFDLDGVLVESEPYWQAGFAGVVNSFARESRWVPPGLSVEHMGDYRGGRVDETLRDILAKIGHPDAAQDTETVHALTGRVVSHVAAALVDQPAPIANSVDTARDLHARGVKLGLASSSAREFIDTALDVVGLGDVFPVRQSAMGLARGKPDPEVYRLVLRQLGERAEDCVAVEDSAAGVGAAVGAGIRCIGLWRDAGTDAPDDFVHCVWVTSRLSADGIEAVLARRGIPGAAR